MKKISRYILVFVTILAAAVALPNLYWLAFEKPISTPFVMYSSLEKDFFIIRFSEDNVRTDTRGNIYTRDEFESKLPLYYARQLVLNGTLPDSINGVEMDLHQINYYRSFFRFRPREMFMPEPGLYPLFESESGRANLELPNDVFRISDRMEFIDAETNRIDERKSQMFTTVLNNRNFAYPATKIAGLPTTRKSCDEGYFVVDSKDCMYHIKMIEGEPYVVKIEVPEGLTFRHIVCVDFTDKKYYNYLISSENEIYILTQDDYEFIKLPVEGYDPEVDELRIFGGMFNYTIIMRREGYMKTVALDSDYNKVDEYSETWPVRGKTREGVVASTIFPFQLRLQDNNNSYINFYPEKPAGFYWIIVNIVLMLLQLFVIRRSNLKPGKNIIDLAIIALTGVYGFLAVNFFQNKFFD